MSPRTECLLSARRAVTTRTQPPQVSARRRASARARPTTSAGAAADSLRWALSAFNCWVQLRRKVRILICVRSVSGLSPVWSSDSAILLYTFCFKRALLRADECAQFPALWIRRGPGQPSTTGSSAGTGLRVLIAAGGTGGHVFPAIAIADAIRSASSKARTSIALPVRHFPGEPVLRRPNPGPLLWRHICPSFISEILSSGSSGPPSLLRVSSASIVSDPLTILDVSFTQVSISFVGGDRLEATAVPAAGYDFHRLPTVALERPMRRMINLLLPLRLAWAFLTARTALHRQHPLLSWRLHLQPAFPHSSRTPLSAALMHTPTALSGLSLGLLSLPRACLQ